MVFVMLLGRMSGPKKTGKRRKNTHSFKKDEIELLEENSNKIKDMISERGVYVDRFLIETVACAFKKTLRTNDSRYVGYYLDRQAEDIISVEKHWPGVDWKLLWDARKELLEESLRNNSIDRNKFKLDFEDKIKLLKKEQNVNERLF